MLDIKVWRNPYNTGVNITTPNMVSLQEGITVLVGCNGAGKSTFLLNIQDYCKDQDIPVHLWDNLIDGGSSSVGSIFGGYGEEGDDVSTAAALMTASEGEAIKLNIGRNSRLYKTFLETGWIKDQKYRMAKIFRTDIEQNKSSNIRVLLFDASDSGLSIDGVIEIKEMFRAIMDDAKTMNLKLYIVVSANEYEMARGSSCFDVTSGKYLTFQSYDAYRKFIIQSREKKEKRLDRERLYISKKNKDNK